MVVLREIKKEPAKTIIIDRLHLTQAFRTRSSLFEFNAIEKWLCDMAHPFVILLSIQEEAIFNRIKETDEHRAGTWVKKKAGTYEERTEYYKNQQSTLKQLAKESRLPVLILDTTDKDWNRCLNKIVEFIGGVEAAK